MTSADFDEYGYLEQALNPNSGTGNQARGESEEPKHKEHRSKEHKHREKHKHRDRDRYRERSRERDRDRRDRDRYDSRDRYRDRYSERERDRHRYSSRDRESDRHYSRDRRDRDYDNSYDRDAREDRGRRHDERDRKRSRDVSPRREITPPEERARKEQERELRELNRDTRTVFAYNLNLKAEERDVFEFFSKAGRVVDVKLIMDRNTRRSKGFAYIEMETLEDVNKALMLAGQVLRGQSVMVKRSEAEKNMAWEAQQQAQKTQAAAAQQLANTFLQGGPTRVYVAGLHANMNEESVQEIFAHIGEVQSCTLARDAQGVSLGQGYIMYANAADAQRAVQVMDGQQFDESMRSAGADKLTVQIVGPDASEVAAEVKQPEINEDDDGTTGLKMSYDAKRNLMNTLASSAGLQPIQPVMPPPPVLVDQPVNPQLVFEQGLLGPASPIPTSCILLKNLFDPAEETEPGWENDIQEDVKSECEKYGETVHVYVDPKSKGFVYIKFKDPSGTIAAHKQMHGRFFSKR